MASLCIAKFSTDAREGVGATDGTRVWDLSGQYSLVSALVQAVAAKPSLLDDAAASVSPLALTDVALRAPIDAASRIFCVAHNYRHHIMEMGQKIPVRPLVFMKFPNSLIGNGEVIQGNPASTFLDYEAEVAVVIAKSAFRVPAEKALEYIGGYTLLNDVTARDFLYVDPAERRLPDWLSAKALDRSTPVGPWITPAHAIPDPTALHFQLTVNGERLQQGDLADLVFSVSDLIAFLSDRLTLLPGDIIATGTPSGVGHARNRPLRSGEILELRSEQLGTLRNQVS